MTYNAILRQYRMVKGNTIHLVCKNQYLNKLIHEIQTSEFWNPTMHLSASSYSSFDSNVSYKNLGKNVYSNPELKKNSFPKDCGFLQDTTNWFYITSCHRNFIKVFAFAFNAKSFENAILVFFSFFPSRSVFWTDYQKFFNERFIIR